MGPEQSSHRPKGTELLRGVTLGEEATEANQGLRDSKEGTELREPGTVQPLRVFLVPGKFSRPTIPTEKMKPGSCPGVQPFISEMVLGRGSWPLSLGVHHPCGDQ